ncbi:hypothetical protein E2562_038749 [Oryza meyeriana var. granulata]|uniref:Uncharacterized protein n=1 Tax=Oryza meyeriana var. granulata TaxID=110450 RepID=A0A6G1CBN0_9ORYZ|nr:hypothetical protein E2562_038749 [Oryza meyeriana var. granulata]
MGSRHSKLGGASGSEGAAWRCCSEADTEAARPASREDRRALFQGARNKGDGLGLGKGFYWRGGAWGARSVRGQSWHSSIVGMVLAIREERGRLASQWFWARHETDRRRGCG